MRRIKEYTALLKIRVFYTGGAYTFNIESGAKKAPGQFVFRGDHDSFVRFLMGIKAKDNKTWPRSVRGERYADIADEIENGSDQIIYVWEHDYLRYLNKKKENKVRESVMDIWDFQEYINDTSSKWKVYEERLDLISYSYKDKIFLDFTKDEKGNVEDLGIKMSNSVGDIDVEVYSLGIKKVEVSSNLIAFRNKQGDEINLFLR